MNAVLTLFLATSLLLSSAIAGTPVATPGPQSDYDPAELLAIKPGLRDTVAANMPAGMTEYQIEIELPELDAFDRSPTLEGQQTVVYTNTTGEPITELPFRLYANNRTRTDIEITSIRINDDDASWELSERDSVAMVDLGAEIEPNDSVTLEMEFRLNLPVDDSSHYGILNHSSRNGTTVLAHWYPVVAGRDPQTSWMLKPTSEYGDPVFTDAGLYEVTVHAPEELTVISSGVETNRQEADGRAAIEFNAKPSRDFVIITGERLESASTEVDGTEIISWALPSQLSGAENAAEWTANTLRNFNPLLGEYPWQQLHVAAADVFNASAVELPQMFIMGSNFYTNSQGQFGMQTFEFTVAHEAIHMWFYSLVGNNQYDHAYIDEGITNYLSADVYFRLQYDDDRAEATRRSYLENSFRRMVETNSDVIVDHPTDDYPSSRDYVNAAYVKGPLGFHAIHQAMGDDAFFAGLRDYVDTFQFRVGTPADMEAALQAQTDVDIRELWSRWFERREGGLDTRGLVTTWAA